MKYWVGLSSVQLREHNILIVKEDMKRERAKCPVRLRVNG